MLNSGGEGTAVVIFPLIGSGKEFAQCGNVGRRGGRNHYIKNTSKQQYTSEIELLLKTKNIYPEKG
jgi:hypothetical protein